MTSEELEKEMMECTTYIQTARWVLQGQIPLGKFKKLSTIQQCQSAIKKWLTTFLNHSRKLNDLEGTPQPNDNTYIKFMSVHQDWAKLMRKDYQIPCKKK